MKLADYVAEFLAAKGVRTVFGMSGGAAVHLFDSISRADNIDYVCVQHEQAAAMAADGYAREAGSLGVALTTSGPGATNLLTGVCCSYYDSIPTLMLTGQVSSFRIKKDPALRQKGFQETDIVTMAGPVTKAAIQLESPELIRRELEKCFWIAHEGRPGPVLLDIPDDFQRAEIAPSHLTGFDAPKCESASEQAGAMDELEKFLLESRRPVFILGAGLNKVSKRKIILDWLESWNVPYVLTWGGKSLAPTDHELNAGLVGVCGARSANYAVQNADLIVTLGSRLSQNIIGGKTEWFGREAKLAVVDIDPAELAKFDELGLDVCKINADAFEVINRIVLTDRAIAGKWAEWRSRIGLWKSSYESSFPNGRENKRFVDAVEFSHSLSQACEPGERCVVDTGGTLTWFCRGFSVKNEQQIHSAWNFTPMGYALPASIGISKAARDSRVICVMGDGGLLLCLPEMATAARHQLPIKLFVYDNQCHGIQKHTLETWLGGRYVGVDEQSGLGFPDFIKTAEAFGWRHFLINSEVGAKKMISQALNTPGPVLVDVKIDPAQPMTPMLKYGRPLEDQHPLLERGEFEDNMVILPVPESREG